MLRFKLQYTKNINLDQISVIFPRLYTENPGLELYFSDISEPRSQSQSHTRPKSRSRINHVSIPTNENLILDMSGGSQHFRDRYEDHNLHLAIQPEAPQDNIAEHEITDHDEEVP